MDVNVAQQITELAQAATRAAQAATTVAEKFGSKGMSAGMESASKVLKNPDAFNGEDAASFMGWKLNFETWMSYGDERFNDLLGKVEKMDRAPSYASYDSEQKSMANKFFAILSSYLRGRTSVNQVSWESSNDDGYSYADESQHPQQQQFGPSQQQQENEQVPKVQRVQAQQQRPQINREQQQQSQAPSSSSSGSSTSYVGSVGTSSFGSVVRRIYDLELPVASSSSSSSVRMVVSIPSDFFYEWFEGRLDFDENLQLIDQSLEQSPRSDDDAIPLVVRVAQSVEDLSCEHVENTFIIQVEPGKPGAEVSKKKTISQRKNLPIECAQGDRPARCPNHFFAVNLPSAVPWW